MKLIKTGFFTILVLIACVFVINADDDITLISPYVGENFQILERDKPTKVLIQKLNSTGEDMSDKLILTDNPKEMQALISDLKWTWVTTLKDYPSDEWYYSLSFESESDGLIYPFYYYPQSDVILFLGYENPLSMNSSDTLKHLINSIEQK